MAKSKRTIVLFSRWFPYNKVKEQSFLEREIALLNEHFERVIIIPQQIEGEKFDGLPDAIEVDESLAKKLSQVSFRHKLKTIFSIVFIRELIKIRFNRLKLKYIIASRVSAIITEEWLTGFLSDKKDVVLYSFWMDFTTLGFAMTKRNTAGIKAVSRCHNFDLYGNDDNQFYVPFQKEMINGLDGVYPDSFGGAEFINKNFSTNNCKAAIMGVPPVQVRNRPSEDGVVRIISCAYMIPRKRVTLFAKALLELSQVRNDLKIIWTHVGEGPEFNDVEQIVRSFKGEVKGNLVGNLSTNDLRRLYIENPFDLFVNTSTKEGTPVSIMEAISHGIPVMATDFGGNREIVMGGAGILLSADPTTEEISTKLIALIDANTLNDLRTGSLDVWERGYNSEKNYLEFCTRLTIV